MSLYHKKCPTQAIFTVKKRDNLKGGGRQFQPKFKRGLLKQIRNAFLSIFLYCVHHGKSQTSHPIPQLNLCSALICGGTAKFSSSTLLVLKGEKRVPHFKQRKINIIFQGAHSILISSRFPKRHCDRLRFIVNRAETLYQSTS